MVDTMTNGGGVGGDGGSVIVTVACSMVPWVARMDAHNWTKNYEMAVCDSCLENGRTKAHEAQLSCGCKMQIDLCKTCTQTARITEGRGLFIRSSHIRVGDMVRNVKAQTVDDVRLAYVTLELAKQQVKTELVTAFDGSVVEVCITGKTLQVAVHKGDAR